jgi:hypothetical protein
MLQHSIRPAKIAVKVFSLPEGWYWRFVFGSVGPFESEAEAKDDARLCSRRFATMKFLEWDVVG